MGTVDVTVRGIIAAPRARVASFAGDPSNAPAWYSNIRSVRWHGEDRSVRVGALLDFVARFLGRELSYTYEIVELVPDRRLVMRTASGPFPMETTYEWWDEGEDTGMSLRNHGAPRGFASLGSGAMSVAMRRAMTQDLRRLDEVLRGETGAGLRDAPAARAASAARSSHRGTSP
ncbi:SRPBCC family protein [Ornithinimicrobium tianjinense]|uniref:ATPase n=1 Tax=Ornithinimicrobium tianjinense TaxID=1195761 RepID=A0A917BDZ5_9MICO|nr:SRPBCC family protein [Ornithinimicrobium tianjinense]GGF37063.1 ATPase [Ornithinimicrobium tianjinense]